MKNFTSVFIIILVLAITGSVIGITKKRTVPIPSVSSSVPAIDLSPEINAQQLCYIYNTEAGDKAMLSMDIRENNVIGEFNWLPFEKDKKTGIFKGTITRVDPETLKQTADVWWDTNGEGMKVTEELKIIFGEGIASPGFGEMKDRGDGVYIYTDPTAVNYSLNLAETDCGDTAMD